MVMMFLSYHFNYFNSFVVNLQSLGFVYLFLAVLCVHTHGLIGLRCVCVFVNVLKSIL